MELMDDININAGHLYFSEGNEFDPTSVVDPLLNDYMMNFASSGGDVVVGVDGGFELSSPTHSNTSVVDYSSALSGNGAQQSTAYDSSYPSSPLNSSPFNSGDSPQSNCTLSPEVPFDNIPTSAQYTEFLNNLKPVTMPNIANSPFTSILESGVGGDSKCGLSDEDSDKKGNSKKRISDSRVQNLVHPLTRDELLKLTGKEPVRVVDHPTNSIEEERTVKKQRRLIKNRESAQLSRMRKKIYIQDLEKKISDLTSDNDSLKDEVLYLQGLVRQLIRENNNNNTNVNVPTIDVNTNNQQQISYNQKVRNIKTAGVCLLIIFFSFGVFFQNTNSPVTGNAGVSLNFQGAPERTTHSMLSLPETNNFSNNHDRNVQNTEINDNDNSIRLPSLPNSDKKRLLESTTTTNTENEKLSPKKRIRITSNEDRGNDRAIESTTNTLPVIEPPHSTSSELQQIVIDRGGNTPTSTGENPSGHSAYIICSDTPRIISNNLTQTTESMLNSNSSSPLTIGLVLPANSLDLNIDHSIINGGLPSDRSVVEISCQVSNVRIWNYQHQNPLDANTNPLDTNSIVISTL